MMPRLGLDNPRGPVILASSRFGTINRQTGRKIGAQSEGPRIFEVAWLPKPKMSITVVSREFRSASACHRRDRGVRWLAGPGLFFAVAAVLSQAAWAEFPVGLEARGVDPLSAVVNRMGLDVRDELGRPVSGRLVLEQLKKASAARSAEISFASRLPHARVILPSLELDTGGGAWWTMVSEALPLLQAAASLPSPRPKLSALLLALMGAVLVQGTAGRRPRYQQISLSSCRRCLEILRC